MSDLYVIRFSELGMGDVPRVGGKNASLGEMLSGLAQSGVQVPDGFATTAHAFWEFLNHSGLKADIDARLAGLDVDDVNALAAAGREIRERVLGAELPVALREAIEQAWGELTGGDAAMPLAVRSSATAEDLPEASFAGQQETFLNIAGLDNVIEAVRHVFASLYNDRAIAYRVHHGFDHAEVALSAGVQRMVRSDLAASGVMFTLDTESGFRDVVFITGSYGLGEAVVQGAVNPDEFYVYKPNLDAGRPAILSRNRGGKALKMVFTDQTAAGRSIATVDVDPADRLRFSLTDVEVEQLARHAMAIEAHYGRPMDIEWGKDGRDGQLYILQARPETVKARETAGTEQRYTLHGRGTALVEGRAIGQRIADGPVRLISSAAEMDRVEPGDILVTDMTDPDWEPVMKRAAAIVTNRGGRTCHAAIVARELGLPAIVGCGDASERLMDGTEVTVSCAEGDTGYVYAGRLDWEVRELSTGTLPQPPVRIMMNVGNPERAFAFRAIPNAGVGLARLEFIINNRIGVHPRAILDHPNLPDDLRETIDQHTSGYASPREFYVSRIVEGVATIAAAFHPNPVIVRLSDFKSNEYANLIGGEQYEPHEENPMIGFRGASRYVSKDFRPSFALECEAMRRVRNDMGLTNVELMIPFVRTLEEAHGVIEVLEAEGLRRGDNGLRIVMMCELPSNVVLAERFLEVFDGFSIGSNDMTQLTLGLDRDSGLVAHVFDERNPAVLAMLRQAIRACKKAGRYVGICGQGPSDYPELAEWLVAQGIDSISLNPDTVISTWQRLAETSTR
ncbi:MAG: phosphoenolpyruvate synthase [Chromatiales bacterium]|nr:phosphoenolpyruvate synthase [Chromatiales bacterium]